MTTLSVLNFSPAKRIKLIILMIITIIGICKNAQGQISESFESGLPGAYTATTSYTLTSGVWTGQANGVIQGSSNPCAGTRVLQLRSQTGAQITSPNITTGVGTVTFCGSGSTTSASVQVNYSTDGGSTWTAATGSPFSLGTSSATYTATVNSCAANVLVQFYRTAATVYIDNINTTTYSCGCTPPSNPSGTISGTTPACINTTLSYDAPSASIYWQTSATGTSTAQTTETSYTVTTTGNYYVRAYNGTCWSTLLGGPYAVTINSAPTISTHPSTTTRNICSGASLTTLTVTATGGGLSYLWYSNTANSNSGGTSLGVTTNTYTPSNTLIGVTYYYCVVTNGCGSVTSNVSGSHTVNAAPTAPPAPTPANNPSCGSTTLATMSPAAGETYYWQGTNSTGTSTANTTATAYTVSSSNTYYVRARDNTSLCWSAVSSVSVTIRTPIAITGQPSTAGQTPCLNGSSTALSVTATGTTPTYQWYSNTANSNSGGTLISGATSSSYTPPTSVAGTTYYYVIVSGAAPCASVTSNVSGSIVVSGTPCSQCPYLTSALVNSCDAGSCDEGDNEILFLNSGDYSFNGTAANVDVRYGSSANPATGFTDSYATNNSAINSMNSGAGCTEGDIFIDASSGINIPANSNIMIVRSSICANAYDWTGLCGSGDIYVLFSTDANWTTGGNFVNGGGVRYFTTDFTNVDASCELDYTYDSDQLVDNGGSGDGAFITFPNNGGAADSYTNTGCALSAIILPVTVSKFYYEKAGNAIMLKWDVREEKNTNYYLIEKSLDGIHYDDLSLVYSANKTQHTYFKVDESPILGYNYYRLSSVDYDGHRYYHQTLIVNNTSNVSEDLTINYGDEVISVFPKEISEEMEFYIVEMTGKAVKHFNLADMKDGYIALNRAEYSKGVYVIRVTQKHKTYTKKIIIY